jgi:hypothetical protein
MAVGAAASQTTVLGPVAADGGQPRAFRVTKVEYEPDAQLTGQATNFRTVQLVNKGPTGALTAVLAQFAFDAAADIARLRQARDIPLLNPTEGTPVVREGDQLQWESVPTGTGLADPGGTVYVSEGAV